MMRTDAPTTPVADRLSAFGVTIFAEISRLAVEHDAINLGQGFPNFDGPDFVKQAAIDAIQAGHNQYPPTVGLNELTTAIARHAETSLARPIDPATEVTVTSGCTEALAAAFLGLINPGDEVILFEPYYDCYRACVSMAGAVPRFVTLNAPDFGFDGSELRSAFSERTRAIVVNTPHNPTGAVFTRAQLSEIASLCIEHDVIAIADEVYEHLVYDGAHIAMASLDGMAERTITLSSLGKTFSLTGWKVGWAIAPEHLSLGVRSAHQFLTFTTPPALQLGAAVALGAPESYYVELTESYRSKRDLLCHGLESVGFKVFQPKAGYFIMADHTPFGFDDDVTFCRHLIEHIGVAAIPPSAFYANPEHGADLVRFAFCKDEPTLDKAIERLQRLSS